MIIQENQNMPANTTPEAILPVENLTPLPTKLLLPKIHIKMPTLNLPFDKIKSLLKKAVITFAVVLLLIIISLLFLYFSKLDREIFPLTITGYVRDNISLEGLNNVTVKINDKTSNTDREGKFNIIGYFDDKIEISANFEGYKEFKEIINLNRTFLVFNFNAQINIEPSETGILKGKIITEEPYNFIPDKIFIDLDEVKIATDGSFIATGLTKGNVLFEYQSLNYKDVKRQIIIEEGINILADIEAVPSGDISGVFTDWVNDVSPIKPSIEATNVFEDQILVKDDGKFVINDLEVGTEYSLRISHPNYLMRDYKLIIKQGANQIFNLRMIPNDITAAYPKKKANSDQLFKSDLDGLNEIQITNIKSFEPSALSYDNFELFFRDDYERLRGTGSGSLSVGYKIDLNTTTQTKLTTNNLTLSSIYYFYKAGKLINFITLRESSTTQNKIELRDIDGNNTLEVTNGLNLNLTNLMVSNQKDRVFYTLRKSSTKIDDLYFWEKDSAENEKLLTEEEINIYDVSSQGEIILLTRKNTSTGFEDLVSFDVASRSTKILLQNHDGNNYKFDQDSKEIFYFYAKRDGRNNLFKYDLLSNKTERVTFLDIDEKFIDYYIVDRYIFYTLDDKLYVLDKNAPVSYKLVAEDLNIN